MDNRAKVGWGLALVVPLVLGGCLNRPNPRDGEWICDPESPSDCPGDYVCRPLTCPADYRCFLKRSGERDYYPRGCVLDGVCDVDACETCQTCQDCCFECDPSLADSPPVDMIVSRYEAPTSSIEAREMGVDLDGDGETDNKWGQVATVLDANLAADLNGELDAQIDAGNLLIVMRVRTGYPTELEDGAMVQVLMAEVLDATPIFLGSDEVSLTTDAATEVGLCGPSRRQIFGGPYGNVTIPFPVTWVGQGGFVMLDLHHARIDGDLTGTNWEKTVRLGGGLAADQIRSELLPALASQLTSRIRDDPENQENLIIVDLFDGNCREIPDAPECVGVVDGVGECDDSAYPALITTTELLCNPMLRSAMEPDFDSDGDGEDDLLSFGARLTLAPVTIRER